MALSNANSLLLGGSSEDAMARSARAEYNRKHRSLPHPKYGPYTCPRCEGLFGTSQAFAAHMRSHYRSESEEERRLRLEEKHRRRGNRRGRPARAAAGPVAVAVRPIQIRRLRLKTIARNRPMPVKTERVELQEMELEMEMEMEDVQGIGSALGILETKEEPVI
ncbi:RING-type E3 ubiquitin transferase [Psidium guajava]|nr:RING-type E3 ubiquitin transferase [Psidium guajava]